jgi:hypothetical protein
VLMGFQLLLQALNLDIAAEPVQPLSQTLPDDSVPIANEDMHKAA